MNHIVDTCPLTTFEGGLNLLHEADNDAVMWLESTATAALHNAAVHSAGTGYEQLATAAAASSVVA